MMKWIFSGLILLAVVSGAVMGRMDAVTGAAISDCGQAVQLTIALAGSMCLWGGVMEVAREAGLTAKLSRLFRPALSLIFESLPADSPAAQAICLNISANLLGLGNAATPLGITAMRRLSEMDGATGIASNNMCMFVVINTASLQLIPTTTALLRAEAGAASPMDFMPAAWVASAAAILCAVLMAKLLCAFRSVKSGSPAPVGRLRP